MGDKSRSVNFSSIEVEELKRQVGIHKNILFASFSSSITSQSKAQKWEEIARAVSCISGIKRSVEVIKKKWANVKMCAKLSLADKLTKQSALKTGGGPPGEKLTGDESRILAIIGKESVVGIEGGFDTSKEIVIGKSKSLTHFKCSK
jgi:Myb/SANT-like DNA-binding domain